MTRPLMTIVLATQNPGKLAELRAYCRGLPLEVVSIRDLLPDFHAPAETGTTFEENAVIKARAVASATQFLALADDSGLEVDALGGRPGVRSARFAREGATDGENNAALLTALDEVDDGSRSARFRCVVALSDPFADSDEPQLFSGACEGSIARSSRGESGFGYDPLFVVQGSDVTFAELAGEEKARISHRGQAMKLLLPRLSQILEQRLEQARSIMEKSK